MKNIFAVFIIFLAETIPVFGQLNTELVSKFSYDHDLNDVWGWTAPDSIEYALVGTVQGVSIISLKNPAQPTQVAFVPGMFSIWRDLKTFGHYAYIVADQPGSTDGLLIIDLSQLPEKVTYSNWRPQLTGLGTLQRCHNLYIDEDGFCYLAGCNLNAGGVIIFDVQTEDGTPKFVGPGPAVYSHDVFAKDGLMFSSEIYAGQLGIYDVTDKNNIQKKGAASTPFRFTHNSWVNETGQFVYTTDEKGNAPIAGYDISNLAEIRETDQFRPLSTLNQGVIPHNVHVKDDFLHISYYTDGGVIVDASDPENLVEVANYDTEKEMLNGFFGAWGMYPFFKSGLVLISDISNGLFVVKPQLKRAARLAGIIREEGSGSALFGVKVKITGKLETDETDFSGNYKIGIASSGTYEVVYQKPGYADEKIQVEFKNGETQVRNVFLKKLNSFSIQGVVKDAQNGSVVEGVKVEIRNLETSFNAVTNSSGSFSIPAVFENQFEILAGKWGFQTKIDSLNVNGNIQLTIELNKGYADNFELDLGWTSSHDPLTTAGFWERGIPVGTDFNGQFSNPGMDSPNDEGDFCFVTGNKGGAAGDDDVDGGFVYLKSPWIDLKNYNQPVLNADIWFLNGGGSTFPNDTLKIYGQTENQLVLIYQHTASASQWITIEVQIPTILKSNPFQLVAVTGDPPPFGHLVEAGLDALSISESTINSISDLELLDLSWQFYPNPASDNIIVEIESQDYALEIIHPTGKIVMRTAIASNSVSISHLSPGIYFLTIWDRVLQRRSMPKLLSIAR